jgi:hypothetical protein
MHHASSGARTRAYIIHHRKTEAMHHCEILDQLRLEITYQNAINHIDPYERRNNIVLEQLLSYRLQDTSQR